MPSMSLVCHRCSMADWAVLSVERMRATAWPEVMADTSSRVLR